MNTDVLTNLLRASLEGGCNLEIKTRTDDGTPHAFMSFDDLTRPGIEVSFYINVAGDFGDGPEKLRARIGEGIELIKSRLSPVSGEDS